MAPIIEITDREEARWKFERRENLWTLAAIVLMAAILGGFFWVIFHQNTKTQPVWIESYSAGGETISEIKGLPRALVLKAILDGKGYAYYHLVLRGETTSSFREGASLREKYREKYPADIIWVDANTVWIISVYTKPNPEYFTVIPKP